jgi:hypothetical protein
MYTQWQNASNQIFEAFFCKKRTNGENSKSTIALAID